MQFNAFFGFSWCEQQDETCRPSNVYVYNYNSSYIRRTNSSVIKYATRANNLEYPVMGVQGFSILSQLPHFDIIDYFVYDSMHGVDLGVITSQHILANLWFASTYSKAAWYMGGCR